MLTEEQARELRCCGPEGCGEYRGEDVPSTIPNIDPETGEIKSITSGYPLTGRAEPYERFCIASKCSAWRWGEAAHWEGNTSGMRPEDTGAVTVRRGFCGLAGRPE